MTLEATASVSIERPVADVATIVFDPTRDPEWLSFVDDVELLTPGELRVGSRVRRRGTFMGQRIDWAMEVTDLDPDRRIAMRTVDADFPAEVSCDLESLDGGDGTEATIAIRTTANLGFRGRLIEPLIRRTLESDAERLRELVEGNSG